MGIRKNCYWKTNYYTWEHVKIAIGKENELLHMGTRKNCHWKTNYLHIGTRKNVAIGKRTITHGNTKTLIDMETRTNMTSDHEQFN
jgi:hypothetical protein